MLARSPFLPVDHRRVGGLASLRTDPLPVCVFVLAAARATRGGERYFAGRRYGPRPEGAVRTRRGRERRGRGGTRRRPNPAIARTPRIDPAIAPIVKRTASSPSPRGDYRDQCVMRVCTRYARATSARRRSARLRATISCDVSRISSVTSRIISARKSASSKLLDRSTARVLPMPAAVRHDEPGPGCPAGSTVGPDNGWPIGPGIGGTRPLPSAR